MFGLVGSQWEQQIVEELDSALDRCVDSIPDHCLPPLSFTHVLLIHVHV
jgi:hypothetical protein